MTTSEIVVLLKWAAQVLLFASGLWALMGVEASHRDDTTGKRRLTGNGWAKVMLLVVGLGLFVASDVHERKTSEQRRKLAERDAYDKALQVQYLQRLILLQFDLAALEVRWKPDSEEVASLSSALVQSLPSEVDPTERAYLECALRTGDLSISRTRQGRFRLDVRCYRGQGMFAESYDYGSPQWTLLEQALIDAFGGLRIELESGLLVAEPLGRHWPCEVRVDDGELVFTLERPAIKIGQLDGARVVLVTAPDARSAPRQLRLKSHDTNVELDAPLDVTWREEVLREVEDPDGATYRTTRLRSGPNDLAVRYSEALRVGE